jgi:hypothetical protein
MYNILKYMYFKLLGEAIYKLSRSCKLVFLIRMLGNTVLPKNKEFLNLIFILEEGSLS